MMMLNTFDVLSLSRKNYFHVSHMHNALARSVPSRFWYQYGRFLVGKIGNKIGTGVPGPKPTCPGTDRAMSHNYGNLRTSQEGIKCNTGPDILGSGSDFDEARPARPA